MNLDRQNFENEIFNQMPERVICSNFRRCTFNAPVTFERCNLIECIFNVECQYDRSNVIEHEEIIEENVEEQQ